MFVIDVFQRMKEGVMNRGSNVVAQFLGGINFLGSNGRLGRIA